MTDEELRAVEDRERRHLADHEQMGSLMESCLPNSCGEDNDIAALITEVKRLRAMCPCLYDGMGRAAMFCAIHRPSWSQMSDEIKGA